MQNLIFLILLAIPAILSAKRILKDSPVEGICDTSVKSLSGYFQVDEKLDKNYFFWFFESRSQPSTDPLVIWLTGGPGCSSQLALLSENGPCSVTEDGLNTKNNPYSWTSNANVLWVDQPAGVGFSYGVKNDHNQTMVAEDMYHFVQEFLIAHPEYSTNDFFIFGESYGGHYVPAISNRIYNGNLNNEGLHVNLKGVAVGNGLTDPLTQYQYYPAMAMNNTYGVKAVTEEQYQKMVDHMPLCLNLIKACQANTEKCEQAYTYCNLMETTPYYNSGLNPYDIRIPCGDSDLCYDFSNIETFLNLESTRQALHVSDKVKSWESCNTAVDMMFVNDWMIRYQDKLIPLLEDNIRVLIYAGDTDFICNWMGNDAWTKELKWSGKNSFNKENDVEWYFNDYVTNEVVNGGLVRTANAQKGEGKLTFLRVYGGGHMVPTDVPNSALALLNTFLQNKDFY